MLAKISDYSIAQRAKSFYINAKKTHPLFKFGAEKAEQISAPFVSVIPKVPGAKQVDTMAAQAVGCVEGLVTSAHASVVKQADRALGVCERIGSQHGLISWAVRTPLRMSDAVVSAVLPEQNAEVARVDEKEEPRTLVQALDKHIDLAHSIRSRVVGKTFRQLLTEASRGSQASAVRLADWAVSQLPTDVQSVVKDNEMRKKDGLILYALRVASAATKFVAYTLPFYLLNVVRTNSRKATDAVSTRAVQEMQELGTRGMQATEQARSAIRRRFAGTTTFGRTGTEPSDEKQAMNGEATSEQVEGEHTD